MDRQLRMSFSKTKAGQHPVMKNIVEDQTKQAKWKLCTCYLINMAINIVIIAIFFYFTVDNVGDPSECYISSTDARTATRFKPSPDSVDWAKRFEYWFVAGTAISIANALIYTASTMSKLDDQKRCLAIAQMLGCFNFLLTVGHFVWILVLRYFREEGRVVSGDFLAENDPPEEIR